MEWMKNRNLASSNSNKKTQYMLIDNDEFKEFTNIVKKVID